MKKEFENSGIVQVPKLLAEKMSELMNKEAAIRVTQAMLLDALADIITKIQETWDLAHATLAFPTEPDYEVRWNRHSTGSEIVWTLKKKL